jgi:hypothetical protein
MHREHYRPPPWCLLAALAFPLEAEGQFRRGPEFQVNIYTTATQRNASVAADADGDFVVAWESPQDSSGFGIFARRFSSAGTPLATEFQVNVFTNLGQYAPSVATELNGDFIIVWRSRQDDSDYGVFARRFSSNGDPLAQEFQANTYTPFGQRFPTVAMDADGDFVIAWQTFPNQDGSGYGIFAQRFSSAGAFLGAEFQVNTYTPGYQRYQSVAADADGDFVVAWQSAGQDGASYGVFAQFFSSGGAPLTGEFKVNTVTSNNQRDVSVAAADDAFVIAWESTDQDGAGLGVFARRFSSAGSPLATEFQVNTYTIVDQFFASAAAEADGDFVVAWTSGANQDGSANGIFARRFSSAGSPQATEFRVNTYTPGYQRSPAVAASDDGDFVVAWWSGTQDGSYYGIFGQRFAASLALDIDGNGVTEPLTDGLLVLRYFFDFTGTSLTTAAVGGGCTRCNAAAIEPHLAALGLDLDIDGNSALEPLSDGLLALRWLFGFTGPTLTTGAVGMNCTRCNAAAIEPYLATLTD